MTHAYGPTIREIRTALGIRSNWAVQTRLDKLEREGKIRRHGRAARTIEVVKVNDDTGYGAQPTVDPAALETTTTTIPA